MYDVITVNPTGKIFTERNQRFRPILPLENVVNTDYHTECYPILSINMAWVKKAIVSTKLQITHPTPLLCYKLKHIIAVQFTPG